MMYSTTGLASVLDTLENRQRSSPAPTPIATTVAVVVAARPRVRHSPRLQPCRSRRCPRQAPDLVIVPALACKQARHDRRGPRPARRRRSDRADPGLARPPAFGLAAACTGDVSCSAAPRCSTAAAPPPSWWLGADVSPRVSPAVDLDEAAMLVVDRQTVTAGARASAHFRPRARRDPRAQPEPWPGLVAPVSVDRRPAVAGGRSWRPEARRARRRSGQALRGLDARPPSPSRSRLAHGPPRAIGASERTLAAADPARVLGQARRSRFVQDLRLEARAVAPLARHPAAASTRSPARSATGDASTLRTLLRRRLHVGVREAAARAVCLG